MLNRSRLPVAVGHAGVVTNKGFPSVADYFHTGELDRDWWKEIRTLDRVAVPLRLTDRAFVVIDGPVLAELTLPSGGAVVVHGDVRAAVRTGGQCEVVVAGDVADGGSVSGAGILQLFVGGDVMGRVGGKGWSRTWVEGSLHGKVRTGLPGTDLWVGGDCTADIRPRGEAALLYLAVSGFMAYGLLEATAAAEYTEFNASIGTSDRPPGVYPDRATAKAFQDRRSFNRWVIHRGAAAEPVGAPGRGVE